MKKTLLGTTALVSAGLVAGPALASDPLSVTVGGTFISGFYVIDADDIATGVAAGAVTTAETRDTEVKIGAADIFINAEGTLDNGLVAGAELNLQLGDEDGGDFTDDVTFDEAFIYLEGGFGRFELGGEDGAAYNMHHTSPWFVPGNGVDSPNILNAVTTATVGVTPAGAGVALLTTAAVRTGTFALMSEDANKVTYFTPRLAGFQFGASYTPDNDPTGEQPGNGPDPKLNGFGLSIEDDTVEDIFDLAVNWVGEIGALEIGVDGFYATGDAPTGAGGDPEEYGGGANIGWAGFTLGGAYYQGEDILFAASAPGVESEVWTAGLAYGAGPWTIGVAYLNSYTDYPVGALIAGLDNDSSYEQWQFGGGYALGAGVEVGLDVQLVETNLGSLTENDSNSAGLVFAVAF